MLDCELARMKQDSSRNFAGRQDMIHKGNQAVRGGEIVRLGFACLGNREATGLLDCNDPKYPIVANAGQKYANRPTVLITGDG